MIIREIAEALYKAGFEPCFLDPDNLSGHVLKEGGDIDMLSNGNWRQIGLCIQECLYKNKYKLVNYLLHDGYGTQFIVFYKNDFLFFDLYREKWRGGNFVFSFDRNFEKIESEYFYTPAPINELEYIIVKRISKKIFLDRHYIRLWNLVRNINLNTIKNSRFIECISHEHFMKILSILGNSNKFSDELINVIYEKISNSKIYYSRFSSLRYYASKITRVLHRILKPTGVCIAVLGADGSGKSIVIEYAIAALAPAFRRTRYVHLRPAIGLGKRNGGPVIDPHGKPPRSWVVSVVKVFYFLFDYTAGWWAIVRPQLVCSNFVIFDRYYHDLLVDPKRYRYGGPMWLARWVGKLIPKPDLWILLDAPAEVLQARKQEVPFEETARQKEGYLKLVKGMKNGVVVDASQNLDDVVSEVNAAILGFMAERTAKRLGR